MQRGLNLAVRERPSEPSPRETHTGRDRAAPTPTLNSEQLRARLAATLIRGRPRPPTAQLVEDVHPVAPPSSLPWGGAEILWSRAVLSAPDPIEPGQATVPLLFAELAESRTPIRPAVVLLHGTGSCGESCAIRAAQLARRGLLVVLPDSRHHGNRADAYRGHDVPWGNEQYQDALVDAWEANGATRPFAYDTAADMFYLADYLSSRPDIGDLAITGISLGGIHAWFAAAADVRWQVVAPLIGVQSFEYAARNNCATARVSTIPLVFDRAAESLKATDGRERRSCCEEVVRSVWKRICPGLVDGEFDAAHTLPLIAPRPLFIGNGRDDPRCPVDGLVDIIEVVRAEYSRILEHSPKPARAAKDLFAAKFYECAHELCPEMWHDCVEFIDNGLALLNQ